MRPWSCSAIAVFATVLPRVLALAKPADLISAAAEVERQNPRFGQRLLTVTSLLGKADYRGSDEILIRLTREVGDQVAIERAGGLIPVRSAVRPLCICMLLALPCVTLLRVPSLGFGRLTARFMDPLAAIPPVTTTLLEVSPKDCDVMQSKSVTITVRTERLGDSPVMLYLNGDDHNWSRMTMSPPPTGNWRSILASVDRDLHYYVTGGDARSPDYTVHVLRAPTISQFRLTYQYPPYTGLPPSDRDEHRRPHRRAGGHRGIVGHHRDRAAPVGAVEDRRRTHTDGPCSRSV